MRQKLSKLGFTFDMSEIDDIDLQVWAIIANEIEKYSERKLKKG